MTEDPNKGIGSKSKRGRKIRSGRVVGALSALALTAMTAAALLPNKPVPQSLDNINGYLLTVNPTNTYIRDTLGWPESDVAVYSYGLQSELEEELMANGGDNYGVLVMTGHHYSGQDFVFGTSSQQAVHFENLPRSDSIEAVVFSACTTAKTDEETVENVYKPLIEKFPNLKVIVGFQETSLSEDGVVPAILNQRSLLRGNNGLESFADKAISINPNRVGVIYRQENGDWLYKDVSGVQELESLN